MSANNGSIDSVFPKARPLGNTYIPSKRVTSMSRQLRQWLSFHTESTILSLIVGLTAILCLLRVRGYFSFQPGTNLSGFLGTVIQSLTSIFAIVFSISIIVIERYSEEQSRLFVGLYFRNYNFIIPFTLNFLAVIVNLFLFSNVPHQHFTDYGILLVFGAIFSIPLFFVFTVRFLKVENIVRMLLHRLRTNPRLFSVDFSNERLYRKYLQPIEDTILRSTELRRYTTSKYLLDLVEDKMSDALLSVMQRMSEEREQDFTQLQLNMSNPFAKLLRSIALFANKTDAIEITIYTIEIVTKFVEKFNDARFSPSFKIFNEMLSQVNSQAKYRFIREEFTIDLARLEVAIASARASFSDFAW